MNVKYCVIGLGYFGYHLAIALSKAGAEVLAVDNHQDKVDEIAEKVTHAVCMDSTDKRALRSLGLEEMDAVIVAIGEGFESSIMTTAHLQELGIKKIYNRVTSKVHERILDLMNIEELLLPEAEAAEQLKNRLMTPGLIEAFKINDEYGIFEIQIPDMFVGKTIIETDLRKQYNLNLVTIKRKGEKKKLLPFKSDNKSYVIGVPQPSSKMLKGDILFLFGSEKDIKKLLEEN